MCIHTLKKENYKIMYAYNCNGASHSLAPFCLARYQN
jgi:hypothetical protein